MQVRPTKLNPYSPKLSGSKSSLLGCLHVKNIALMSLRQFWMVDLYGARFRERIYNFKLFKMRGFRVLSGYH